jgi:modulator of FtsH protease
MDAFEVAGWESFGVAMAGAAAVLVGLIFVAMSINMERLLTYPWLVSRAADAVLILMVALVAATLLLVPGIAVPVLAWSLVAVGVVSALSVLLRSARRRPGVEPRYRRNMDAQTLIATACLALFAVAGLSLVVGDGGGLYWLVPAALGSLGVAVLDSWVLLVEINR